MKQETYEDPESTTDVDFNINGLMSTLLVPIFFNIRFVVWLTLYLQNKRKL